MDLPDEAIVEEFRQTGDSIKFKSLVRRYQNRIYNAAFRILGNQDEAEEVTQDTFLKVHQGLSGFRKEASFASWIFRIAHNLCVDIVRTKQRRTGVKLVSFDPQSTQFEEEAPDMSGALSQIADPLPSPSQKVDLEEQQIMIEKSLLELPESQRAVVVLHDIEGFQYQEIADIVGTSVGTVRSRLHYGRLKLREILAPYFDNNNQNHNKGMPAASR